MAETNVQPNTPKKIIVRCCDDCGLSTNNASDGLWICAHREIRKKGLFINVTRPDGKIFKRGVSKRCPLRYSSVLYELAEDVEFI